MLKKITEKEREEIAKLLAEYWSEREMSEYDKKWAEEYLAKGHKKEIKRDEFFVYKENNKIIGNISLITDVSDVAEIKDFVVKPEYRRKGYGKKMLKELIKIAEKRKIRKLYVLIFPKYEKIFQKLDFEKEGKLRSHFAAGEDLIIMSKFLTKKNAKKEKNSKRESKES